MNEDMITLGLWAERIRGLEGAGPKPLMELAEEAGEGLPQVQRACLSLAAMNAIETGVLDLALQIAERLIEADRDRSGLRVLARVLRERREDKRAIQIENEAEITDDHFMTPEVESEIEAIWPGLLKMLRTGRFE